MSNLKKMLPTSSILEEVSKLEAIKQIKVSVNSCVKYGALVGATTIVSGLLAGPVGLAAGGIISSFVAGLRSQGEFKSVVYILLYETTPEEREKLATLIRKKLTQQNIITMGDFICNIKTNESLHLLLVEIIIGFVTKELHRTVRQ